MKKLNKLKRDIILYVVLDIVSVLFLVYVIIQKVYWKWFSIGFWVVFDGYMIYKTWKEYKEFKESDASLH